MLTVQSICMPKSVNTWWNVCHNAHSISSWQKNNYNYSSRCQCSQSASSSSTAPLTNRRGHLISAKRQDHAYWKSWNHVPQGTRSNAIHTFTRMDIHEYLRVVTMFRDFFLETQRCWYVSYASTDAECLKLIFQQIGISVKKVQVVHLGAYCNNQRIIN